MICRPDRMWLGVTCEVRPTFLFAIDVFRMWRLRLCQSWPYSSSIGFPQWIIGSHTFGGPNLRIQLSRLILWASLCFKIWYVRMVGLTQCNFVKTRKKRLNFGGFLEAEIRNLLLVCSFLWLAAACTHDYQILTNSEPWDGHYQKS